METTSVIILNGFLGAGKTTLLKNLLIQAHEKQLSVSVIVNDMSELDVDGVLIANTDIVDAKDNKYFRMSLNVTCVLAKLPRCSASRHVIAAVC